MFLLTQKHCLYVHSYTCNHDNVSVSFPAQKSKIGLKIATKTWEILKATYLIALLHISNENTAQKNHYHYHLFEISRYIKYFEIRTKHLLCGIKRCAFD